MYVLNIYRNLQSSDISFTVEHTFNNINFVHQDIQKAFMCDRIEKSNNCNWWWRQSNQRWYEYITWCSL